MVWTGGAQGNLAPSLIALFDQADDRWPFRSRVSDGSLGDTAHASRTSDHNPKPPNPPGWVDAGDLTEDHEQGPPLPALWDHLIATRDARVKYLIYEGRIVKSYVDGAGRPAWVPQPYTGINAHAHHLHISVIPEGRADTSPWFPTEEDDMTPEQATMLEEAHAAVFSMLRGNFKAPAAGDLAWLDEKLQPVVDRLAHLEANFDGFKSDAYANFLLLRGQAGVDLTDEQVHQIIEAMPAAVKQALREGVD